MMTNDEIVAAAEAFHLRTGGTCQAIHNAYTDDIEFGLVGKQWDNQTQSERDIAKRLTLTVNRLRQFIYQVVNDYKKSEMTSKVLPHDTSEKDKKLAEIRRGIMRSLERKKGGLEAYNNACKTLVAGGLGGWQINTKYIPKSMDQEPYFLPIEDMASVIVDFDDCKELDLSDMRECIVYEIYGDKARFKKETGVDPDTFFSTGGGQPAIWGTKLGPKVSNYWFTEEVQDTVCLLSPIAQHILPGIGKAAYLSEIKDKLKEMKGPDDQPVEIPIEPLFATDKNGKPIQREEMRCKVRCAKIAAKQVIGEVLDWPVDEIPVIVVTGRKTVNNGKVVIEGLVRPAKDSQRSYNYLKSSKTERIAQVPKNPIFVSEEGIPATEKNKWDTMATRLWGFIRFKSYDSKGRAIPAPHRNDPIQADQGLIEEERSSVDEIKATLGMYDASIGNRSNETSGVAIANRAKEGDTNNYDFTESMVRAIKRSTRILNKLIPKVYDTERQIQIVGEDDKETVLMINKMMGDGSKDPNSYHMDEGEFDVDYEAGPSSATKGQDIRDNLTAIFSAVPGTVLPLGSEYIRNSEMRNADDAADRFERWANTQSPGLYPDKNQNPQQAQQQAAQMKQQLQQMQQQLQQMGPHLDQLQQENAKLQIENQHIKAKTDIEAAQLQIEQFNADTERMKVVGALQANQTNMLLAADKAKRDAAQAQHDQTLENSQHVHDTQMEHVGKAIDLANAAHGVNMDHQNLQLETAKAVSDHQLRADAQAKAPAPKAVPITPKPKAS